MSSKSLEISPLDQIKSAFHADDATEVHRLLDLHPAIRARIDEPVGPFGSPAIVNVRSAAMLDALLDAGANIDARSEWGPGGFGLLDSVSPDLAEYAITRGATVTAHAAARLGLLDRLRELVEADPSLVHARGGDGQMPLHFASRVEIAAFLLDHGAAIDARDLDHDSTAAQWMIDDRQEVARFLVSRGCQTDLLMAAALGEVELVRQVLDADLDAIRVSVSDEYFPMVGGENGGTIYQWKLGWYVRAHQVARKFGHPDVLALLLERSPAPVKLIDACWSEGDETVRRLSTEHPDVLEELTDEDRRHIAHAARNDEAEVVRLMLQCGLPVDATSQHRATPLHWAAFHGNREMIQILLPHSPSLSALDADFGGTPLGWAIHGSEHGWNHNKGDYAGTVEALLDAGAVLPAQAGGSPAVRHVLEKRGGVRPAQS